MALDLRNMDCMELMAEFPDKYFDLAIVDPPYSETFNTDACADNKGKKGNYKLHTLNNHLPTDLYWNELFRVSKNQIIWGANWYGKYFGVGGVVWFKDNTGNYSPCEYAYQSLNNHIHHFQYRWNGMLQQKMGEQKEERIHPTQKPVDLYKWLLNKFAQENDLILDTHLGSGSIAIACHDYKYNLTASEIDTDYFNNTMKRIKNHLAQTSLF
jgi:site-specific DNA-methyltransferase (adenine-specific)